MNDVVILAMVWEIVWKIIRLDHWDICTFYYIYFWKYFDLPVIFFLYLSICSDLREGLVDSGKVTVPQFFVNKEEHS